MENLLVRSKKKKKKYFMYNLPESIIPCNQYNASVIYKL